MTIDAAKLRPRLRDIGATLKTIDDQQRALRDAQLEQLRIAVAHRGTVGEAARASGLSRAYLHRIDLHRQRGFTDAPELLAGALARAGTIRGRIDQLQQDAADLRAQRDPLIRELRSVMSTAQIATDAGISGERTRLILQTAAA